MEKELEMLPSTPALNSETSLAKLLEEFFGYYARFDFLNSVVCVHPWWNFVDGAPASRQSNNAVSLL